MGVGKLEYMNVEAKPKKSEIKNDKIEADVLNVFTKIPNEYFEEYKKVFDKAAEMTGTSYPRSTSGIIGAKMRTLSSGKQIPERGHTLQDSPKYPELFKILATTKVFDFIFEKYFYKHFKDKNVFIDFMLVLLSRDLEKIRGAEEGLNFDPKEFLTSCTQMSAEIGEELALKFPENPTGFYSSDLVLNMFLSASLLNNL
jgi:hypothetical protein